MKILGILGLLSLTAGFCFGETWSGKLVDATCKDEARNKVLCAPTAKTTLFALETKDGKSYKLDDVGNAKAMAIAKLNPKPDLTVMVEGTMSGDIVKVESMVPAAP